MSDDEQRATEYLQQIHSRLHELEQQVQHLTVSSSSSSSHSTSSRIKPLKPASFDGHTPSAANWTFQMQNYLEAAGEDLNSPHAVADAVTYLKDAAQTWYRQHQQAVEACMTVPFTTWATFKAALLHQFAPIDPQAHARDLLMELSAQQHPDIVPYSEQFTAVAVDLPSMTEADKVYMYTRGLPSDVRMHVRMHNPSMLSAAMELAAQAGEAAHGGSGISPPPAALTGPSAGPTPMELGAMRTRYRSTSDAGPVCYFCNQPGHSFRHCRELNLLKREYAAKQAGHAK
jgi:hypothetical protein